MDTLTTAAASGRTMAALFAVLGVLLLLSWGLRRSGLIRHVTGPSADRLQVLATRALDARTRLVLVRCDDREHLIVVGPVGASTVESRPALPPVVKGPGA